MVMDIPTLYRPITIEFWSLRDGLGASLGVINDIDTRVQRDVRRVICEDGWKFQICQNRLDDRVWDWVIDTDQMSLDEIGMDLDDVELINQRG